jgi:hypothetical protein
MKKIVRSKSGTDFFREKESLDIVHSNLKKFKNSKNYFTNIHIGRTEGRKVCNKGLNVKREILQEKLQQNIQLSKEQSKSSTKNSLLTSKYY